jgi:hypothetical protein
LVALVALCALGSGGTLRSGRALSSGGTLRSGNSGGSGRSCRSGYPSDTRRSCCPSDARGTRGTSHTCGTCRSRQAGAYTSGPRRSGDSGQTLCALWARRSDLIPVDVGLGRRAVERALNDADGSACRVVAAVNEAIGIRDQIARRGDERTSTKSERQGGHQPVADRPLRGAPPQRSCETRCDVKDATDRLRHNKRGLERVGEQVRKTEANSLITEMAQSARACYETVGSAVGSTELSITPTPGTVCRRRGARGSSSSLRRRR